MTAQREGKPILLDIFGHWCHWCHVMDETTYEDAGVIDLISRLYVPVRVDTDRFPDVNDRYNQGGWPTTAILDPSGHVLYGATYIPAGQMVQVLAHVAAVFAEQRDDIRQRIAAYEQDASREPVLGDGVSPHAVEVTLSAVKRAFDSAHGGFGTAPKFPQPATLDFALAQYVSGAQGDLETIVRRSLHGMLPLLDEVGGGFFRYATAADWRVPHYEKMLEGNAGLLGTYADAYRALGDERFADTVRRVAQYLSGPLYDRHRHTFAASQDADVFSHDPARETIAGERYFALDAQERARMGEPYVDETIVAPYNAMAASAFVRAYLALGVEAYLDLARGAAGFVRDAMWRPDGAVYHYLDGAPQRPGLLTAQTWSATACLDLHEVTGEPAFLAAAEDAMGYALSNLWSEQGGFWDAPAAPDAPGLLRHRDKPVLGNARAAMVLLRLAQHRGDETLAARAREAVRVGATGYARYGFMAGEYAQAVWLLTTEPRVLKIVAPPELSRQFSQAALGIYVPGLTVVHLNPEREGARLQSEGLPADPPAAYLCVGRRCLRAHDPAELPGLLTGLLAVPPRAAS